VSDSNVIKLTQPGAFSDSLTEILRNGARALLGQAIEAEVAEFLAKHADLKTATGQQRLVRHGHRWPSLTESRKQRLCLPSSS
jgi:putative transposase